MIPEHEKQDREAPEEDARVQLLTQNAGGKSQALSNLLLRKPGSGGRIPSLESFVEKINGQS